VTNPGWRHLKKKKQKMHHLINLAIDAQGGLDRWRKFNTVTAHLVYSTFPVKQERK
jgi:hypothetical protein